MSDEIDLPSLQHSLEAYKKRMTEDIHKEPLSEYDLGFIHGIELALSFIEQRPTFYIRKDGSYDPYDMSRFPEYFL